MLEGAKTQFEGTPETTCKRAFTSRIALDASAKGRGSRQNKDKSDNDAESSPQEVLVLPLGVADSPSVSDAGGAPFPGRARVTGCAVGTHQIPRSTYASTPREWGGESRPQGDRTRRGGASARPARRRGGEPVTRLRSAFAGDENRRPQKNSSSGRLRCFCKKTSKVRA